MSKKTSFEKKLIFVNYSQATLVFNHKETFEKFLYWLSSKEQEAKVYLCEQ